jgi:hypothetical protein
MRPTGQANLLEQRRGARSDVVDAGNLHRHRHVFIRRQRRDQVKELEHEADLLATQPGERVLRKAGDVDAVDQHLAGTRRVEAGDETEQRGLAAARRPHDGHELTFADLKRERMQDGERFGAARDGLRDLAQLDHDGERSSAIGSSTGHTLSATMRAPAAVG